MSAPRHEIFVATKRVRRKQGRHELVRSVLAGGGATRERKKPLDTT